MLISDLKKKSEPQKRIYRIRKTLTAEPKTGESLGAGLYKIRLASKDKNAGKSGGFRVITYLVTETKTETNVYLLKIYDKSEDATYKTPLLIKLVKSIFG